MKITICGSMAFAKEMLTTKQMLEEQGHTIVVPLDTDHHVENPGFGDDFEADAKHVIEKDLIRDHFDKVSSSDAVLILNYPKNGLDGYVGASTLMEMGFAHYLRKKIFLLHDTPAPEVARWAHEVSVMQPVVLNGDLKKIFDY